MKKRVWVWVREIYISPSETRAGRDSWHPGMAGNGSEDRYDFDPGKPSTIWTLKLTKPLSPVKTKERKDGHQWRGSLISNLFFLLILLSFFLIYFNILISYWFFNICYNKYFVDINKGSHVYLVESMFTMDGLLR